MPATAPDLTDGNDGQTQTSTQSTSQSTSTPATTSAQPSGPTLAERRAMEALRRSYLELLRRWGLRQTKNLLNLVERAMRGQWSSTQFQSYVRQTPEYKQSFKGIRWKTGMTEGQYLSTFAQYNARAQDIGETLTRREFGKLLKRGVSFDEFSDRVDALNAIEEYGPMWAQFQQVLELNGVNVPGKKLSKKELQKFIMGMGPAKWEALYEETLITTNLERVAGVQVVATRAGEVAVPDSYEVTRQDLLDIIKQVEALTPGFELESLSSRDWAGIGKNIRQYSINYLQRYGLTTRDLLEMELGGPKAAKIAERADRLLKTQEAFTEPRAIPQSAMQVGRPQEEELPQSL